MGSASGERGAGAAPRDGSLVAIVGATGTGKSSFSLDLAERLVERGHPVEIVNADAMQLYRGMNIGTAKLPEAERHGIRHHLLDLLDPRDEASVADYQRAARATIDDIQRRGVLPILVGGSGLYVSAVLWDFQFPGTDPVIRARLEAELVEVGPGMLSRRLSEVDPAAAAAIGPHNGRRIVRALEVFELTGKPFGSGLPDESRAWRPNAIIGTRTERSTLVPRLEDRIRRMWRDGIVEEAAELEAHGLGVTAARAIGYAQALAQLRGELSQAEARDTSAVLTRKYARRQVSWFGRYPATWFDSDDPARATAALELVLSHA